MTLPVLLFCVLVMSVVSRRLTGSWIHPLSAYFALWSVITVLLVWNPVHLVAVEAPTIVLILEGLAALAAGGWIAILRKSPPSAREVRDRVSVHIDRASARIDWSRVWWVSFLGLLALAAGTFLERGAISGAAAQPYSTLTPPQIRGLEVSAGASNAGLVSVVYLMAPVVAALGVILSRRNPVGWAVVAVAVATTIMIPDRTFTVTTAVITVMFWLYANQETARRLRLQVLVLTALVATASVVYFLYEGAQLKQNSLITSQIPDSAVPSLLVPAVVYVTAGPPSLSAAMQEHLNPAYGEPAHSIWLLPRVLHLVDQSVAVPNTVASFVPIPFDFNTYTWIGDVFFDFGRLGVLILGFLTGYAVCRVYAWAAERQTYASCFVAAVMATVLFFTVINFRFFWLECAVWLGVGWLVVRWAGHTRPQPA